MPSYNPGGGQNPNDEMFNDGPAPAEDQGGDKGEVTGILPKEILAGKDFKPGEEIVLKIVAIHDNDVEVAYSHGDDEGKEGEQPMKEEPMSETAPSNDMNSMMS